MTATPAVATAHSLHSSLLVAGGETCRYDHPASDCKIMGAEIDRRLASPAGPRADR
jgi:hypothetical protein